MNFRKLAISAATIATALSIATPAFAATAYNKNVYKSFVTAVATENTTYNVNVTNKDNIVVGIDVVVANTGLNFQMSGNRSDGNTLKSGDAQAQGYSVVNANQLFLKFK